MQPSPGRVDRTAAEITRQVLASSDRSVPGLRRIRRTFSTRLEGEDSQLVLGVVNHLIAAGEVPRWFAYELVHHHDATMSRLTSTGIERLGAGISAWDEVDSFACLVSGPAWREGQLEARDVRRWAGSADRWWRRAALVATVPLNAPARGGSGDAERTLEVCERLKHDRDDMVVKAMSWALRELARQDPDRVSEYLAANEDELAPRVLREVRNKLRTGLKNPKRSSKGERLQ